MTGFLGGMVQTTDVKAILRIDLLADDFFHAKAYPTYLYYNPYGSTKSVTLDLGKVRRDVYDAVSKKFILRGACGKTRISIPADRTRVVVLVPSDGRVTRDGGKMLVDGVVVDYAGK
jgi:hypothetical protein